MKIAIIGASGKSGGQILQEAVRRGHDVTAIVHNKAKITEKGVKILEKDLYDLSYDDIKDNEVIIDALGFWKPETLDQHQTSLKHLADLLEGKPNRLLVVGGAGSLFVDAGHTTRLMDTPDFPPSFKPLATAMGKAFEQLKLRGGVKWTYLSPSADFAADGARTGKYKSGGDELLVNSKGESRISYADYAIAMVDEAENAKHVNERFTAVSE